MSFFLISFLFFFFNDTATTEIYTLSLHDALPIWNGPNPSMPFSLCSCTLMTPGIDRKSTRLNSSHGSISYAVFCLKKKNHHITASRLIISESTNSANPRSRSAAYSLRRVHSCFFFFNDTATTEIYTLSLHDALPISSSGASFLHGLEASARIPCST